MKNMGNIILVLEAVKKSTEGVKKRSETVKRSTEAS